MIAETLQTAFASIALATLLCFIKLDDVALIELLEHSGFGQKPPTAASGA